MDATVTPSINLLTSDSRNVPNNAVAELCKEPQNQGEEECKTQVTDQLPSSSACCVLEILTNHPFISDIWSNENRLEIIKSGKPPLDLKNLDLDLHQCLSGMFPWLAMCSSRKIIFCWPCLLYSGGPLLQGTWLLGSGSNYFKSFYNSDAILESILSHESLSIHDTFLGMVNEWSEAVSEVDNTLSKLQKTRNIIETMEKIAALKENRHAYVQGGIHKYPLPSQSIYSVKAGATKNKLPIVSKAKTNKINSQKPSVPSIMTPKSSRVVRYCIVKRLLDCPFSSGSWTSAEQCKIIQNGRPYPETSENVVISVEDAYQNFTWLAVSSTLKKLFCWPCLLFSTCTSEISDLKMTSDWKSLAGKHETYETHLNALHILKIWEKNVRETISEDILMGEDTGIFPQLMKYLIDIICVTHTTVDNSSSLNTTQKILKLVSFEDAKLRKQISGDECGSIMKNKFVRIIDRILKSIVSSIKSKIIKEIEKTPVVSIVINRIDYAPWISITVRYVLPSGCVAERFVKLIKTSEEGDSFPSYLLKEIDEILVQFSCKKKFVGYTYGGGVLNLKETKLFNDQMSSMYPHASFYHDRAQDLRDLVLQSLSHHIPEFLFSAHKLAEYMENSPNLMEEVVKVEAVHYSSLSSSDEWDLTSGFITTLHQHYPAFLRLFHDILHVEDLSVEMLRQASRFLDFLKSDRNCFVIACITRIFEDISGLTKAFKEQFDIQRWKRETEKATTTMETSRRKGYEEVRLRAQAMIELQAVVLKEEKLKYSLDYLWTFQKLFYSGKVCVQNRIYDINSWMYFDLFTRLLTPIERYKIVNDCGSDRIRKECPYRTVFSPRFDSERLKAQLKFMQERNAFLKHDPAKLCRFLKNYDLERLMSELFKFGQLALTVPLAAKRPKPSSSFERIKIYVRHQRSALCSDKALMFIEKELLKSIQKDLLNDFLNYNDAPK